MPLQLAPRLRSVNTSRAATLSRFVEQFVSLWLFSVGGFFIFLGGGWGAGSGVGNGGMRGGGRGSEM